MTSDRVTATIPFGPVACSVTVSGALAVAVTTIAERAPDWALATVVTHAGVRPIPVVPRLAVEGGWFDARPASTIASAAAATSVESTNVKGGRLRTRG